MPLPLVVAPVATWAARSVVSGAGAFVVHRTLINRAEDKDRNDMSKYKNGKRSG